jgi:hypothetical protein
MILIIASDLEGNIQPVAEAYSEIEAAELINSYHQGLDPNKDICPYTYTLWARNFEGRYIIIKTIQP